MTPFQFCFRKRVVSKSAGRKENPLRGFTSRSKVGAKRDRIRTRPDSVPYSVPPPLFPPLREDTNCPVMDAQWLAGLLPPKAPGAATFTDQVSKLS